jgi:L-asparaginase
VRVVLVATGGTIASRPRDDGAVAIALSGAEVLARADLDAAVEVEVVDAAHGPSWAFDAEAMLAIARRTLGFDGGVVVTHGTDTIEETAFLTWLLGGRRDIVFTGAMRHDAAPDADGPANLRGAIALAAGGAVDGPVVHLAGESHHARWATKTDTGALDAFRSLGGTAAPAPPPPPGDGVVTAVAQVHAYTGVDPDVVDWHVSRGARGIVLQGTGAGNVHGSLVPGLERAVAAGVPVVVTSRCPTGRVSPTYGGPGGGRHLADIGCIAAGDLPAHKARLALWVALGRDPGVDAVRAWFAALVGPR